MSSKKKSNIKKRAQRATSNVFAMFEPNQIQEFKEAFYMIDQDKDGFITKEDLADMFASLGKNQSDEMIEEMLNEATGPINFTMFLTLFGVKFNGTDPEDVLRNSFSLFDEKGTGFISEDNLREAMTTMGDRYSNDEFEELINGLNIKNGMINYAEFCGIMKNGRKESLNT